MLQFRAQHTFLIRVLGSRSPSFLCWRTFFVCAEWKSKKSLSLNWQRGHKSRASLWNVNEQKFVTLGGRLISIVQLMRASCMATWKSLFPSISPWLERACRPERSKNINYCNHKTLDVWMNFARGTRGFFHSLVSVFFGGVGQWFLYFTLKCDQKDILRLQNLVFEVKF